MMFTSCNTLYQIPPGTWIIKSQFKKEILLVKEILKNPDKIKEIIETSEFYDPRFQFFNNERYERMGARIRDMTSEELENIVVRYSASQGRFMMLRNTKIIEVDDYLLFIFYEIEDKMLLYNIGNYRRY